MRRLRRLLVIVGVVAILGGYYVYRHLPEVMVALVHREVPNISMSVDRAELVSRSRIELRNLSLRLRQSNVEILHVSKATIDFSFSGLRRRHIDAVTVDDPVVFVDDAFLKQFSANLFSEKNEEREKRWTLGTFVTRDGKAHIDLSLHPRVEFEFSSEPQAELGEATSAQLPPVQRIELNHIEITGRDKQAPSRAEIKSVDARFAINEIAGGHLRELIVRDPSLQLTSEVMKYLPQKSAAQNATSGMPWTDFRIDRLLVEHGDIQVSGLGTSLPEASFKFGLDTTDVRLGDSAEKLHHVQLWDIAIWPASSRLKQFLTVDSVQVDLTPAGLLTRHEIAGVIVTGSMFRAGDDFRSMVLQTQSTAAAAGPLPGNDRPWLIRNLQIHNGHVAVADLGVEIPDVRFDLNTKLNDVPLSSDIAFAGKEIQKVEFADLTLHSPLDPFVTVVNLKTVFVSFSFAQIMHHEIDALVLLNPTIFVSPDLFWYVDQLKKRQAAAVPAAGASSSSATEDAGWRLNRFDAAYGQLVIANEGQAQVPLPLSLSTHSENIRFSNFSDLQLKLNLLVPTSDYSFPDYQIEFTQLGGEIKFGLPPEKQANNLVQTLRSESVRWRQFTGRKLFWSVTYDEKGIYGNFGGAVYGGYLNGQFSFFLKPNSPWEGWISGSKVDLGQLSDVMAPENLHMTGPVDFTMNVKALSREIQQVVGKFNTRRPGHLKIGKIDDLLANTPPQWSGFKQSATRIGLETLRDFDYTSGNGDISFAGKTGKLTLKLNGPNGARNFEVLVH
jgi:hypothetical protein